MEPISGGRSSSVTKVEVTTSSMAGASSASVDDWELEAELEQFGMERACIDVPFKWYT